MLIQPCTRTRQSGFMAIVLVVFLVLFSAIAASIVSMTTSGVRGAADHANAAGALFMAESGIEWAARELFDSADPETACNALAGNTGTTAVNGGGSFDITESTYDSGNGSCRLTSRGFVQETERVLKGAIPAQVLEGDTGGPGDAFDDSEDKFNNCGSNNIECKDGEITFKRPSQGGGAGQPPTKADGDDLIGDVFSDGDRIYFATNIEWDTSDSPNGNVFEVELTNNIAECQVDLPSLSSACTADASSPLYDFYDLVVFLGDDFAKADINEVRLRVNWSNSNTSNTVTLSNGCIGTQSYCADQGSGDDPVDDGTWDESP